MPRLIKRQKQSKNACEIKVAHQNINSEVEAVNTIKKLQEIAKKYYQEYASHNVCRLHYIENSIRTKRRKNQQQRKAAKGTPTLYTFWDTKKSTKEIDNLGDNTDNDDEQSDDEIEYRNWHNKILAALENLELDVKKENMKNEVLVRLNSIRFYLQLIKCNYPKMIASKIVANVAEKGVYHARCIRSWAYDYVMTHQIPNSLRGDHVKIWSFLWDEDILYQVKSYVQEHKWDVIPQMLMVQINEVILLGLGFTPSPTIHLNTARNYLKELEYTYTKVKKGIYIDGHEREDVMAYQKIFLEQMSEFEYRMPIFLGDNLEEITWPNNNTQPFILVTHDECIFLAYDGSQSLWIPDGEQSL